jgi:hypothetical protein
VSLANVLFIHNTAIPASLAAAEWYVAQRGLQANYLGIDFGVTAYTDNGAVTLASFIWNGSAAPFDSVSYQGIAFAQLAQAYPFDGVIMSAYTPMIDSPLPTTPLAAFYAGRAMSARGAPGDVLPNGRLGSPASASSNWGNFATEMIARSGALAFEQSVTRAIESEAGFNKQLPVWGISTATGNVFGFTASYNAGSIAQAQALGCTVTLDMASVCPNFSTVPQANPWDVMALCAALDMNAAGEPGAHPYSSNYAPLPGACAAVWYSYQWYFGMDFVWNGGSAAVITTAEPQADGTRDPVLILPQLLAGSTMMEVLPKSATPRGSPVWPVIEPAKVTILGDPLAAPFKNQQRTGPAAVLCPFW